MAVAVLSAICAPILERYGYRITARNARAVIFAARRSSSPLRRIGRVATFPLGLVVSLAFGDVGPGGRVDLLGPKIEELSLGCAASGDGALISIDGDGPAELRHELIGHGFRDRSPRGH